MRLLDARVHGVLDIVIVILLVTGPLLFGLGGSPAAIAYTLAVVHLVLTLITRFPMGRWKIVPFVVHGIIELGVGVFLLLVPVLGGYGPGSPARRFYTVLGAIVLVVWALTAYRAADRSAD